MGFIFASSEEFVDHRYVQVAAATQRSRTVVGQISPSGVRRQLTPLVLSRDGSEPIWFPLNVHIAPFCGVNPGSSNDPFRTSLDAQRSNRYGVSYAREEDRSR